VARRLGLAADLAGWLVAAAVAGWFSALYLGSLIFGPTIEFGSERPDPIQQILLAAWMACVAFAIGLAAEREAHSASTDPGAGSRAALARFGSGMTALLGISAALLDSSATAPGRSSRSSAVSSSGRGRWMVLVSMRTGATAYLLPGGSAVVLALTAFNATYLRGGRLSACALLVEGLVLLGVGVGVQFVRSRLLIHRLASAARAGA
jgi:hypothetical protein